jgi:GNAT superfamily N-acetyltransferase
MHITLKKVNRGLEEYKRIKNLYNSAFPDDERAPFWVLYLKRNRSGVDFWAIYADGKWAGMAYAVSSKDVTYLFYFAISKHKRGLGIGSAALKALIKKYEGQRFFLALEQLDETSDNYDERLKRRHFYERNGLESLGCKLRESTVVYDVMGTGGNIEPEDYKDLMENYMGMFSTKIFKMEIIK